MKKIIYLLQLLILLTTACTKNDNETSQKNESIEGDPHYYKLGTVITAVKTETLNGIATVTQPTSKISYAIMPPFDASFTFPEVLRWTYTINTEAARSTNGLYSLLYQGDGNLVLYKRSSPNGPIIWTALWATNAYTPLPPSGSNAKSVLSFQADGNIVCLNYNNNIYWASNLTAGPKPIWILQDDGNLVGYQNYTLDGSGTPQVVITGSPFAATFTDGGRQSKYYGRMGPAH